MIKKLLFRNCRKKKFDNYIQMYSYIGRSREFYRSLEGAKNDTAW